MSFEYLELSFVEIYKNILDSSYLPYLQYKKGLYLIVLLIPDHVKFCKNI